MLFRPSVARRAPLLTVVVALASALLAAPTGAANATVTGSLTYTDKVALSPDAVAIITIVDQTAAADAGAIVGQQRIDSPASVPIDFSVLVDAGAIDPTHAYALFASIVDTTRTWENRVGTPVITGGPTNGIGLVLTPVPAKPLATVSGTIVPPSGVKLSSSAVAIAALIKVGTGTLVARQVGAGVTTGSPVGAAVTGKVTGLVATPLSIAVTPARFCQTADPSTSPPFTT